MAKKRKRGERPTIHPRNKYSDKPPDFLELASLYPSFRPYVFYSRDGRPRIDWTDFNATRELTRVLLFHDHSINWWIPDGQLCPTIPNRSNYIHWIEDLLSSDIISNSRVEGDVVKGFDIGTGANCIYPLLGASLLGWSFVGTDVTDIALEWAMRNVMSNPQISGLIEVRKVNYDQKSYMEGLPPSGTSPTERESMDAEPSTSFSHETYSCANKSYHGPPILLGVVKDGEKFDFCMCNPPFFETMEAAGLNPKTSCGGTPAEMVCPGGEQAFISRIIEDSAQLKQTFRWYTSMIGRKSNLKLLTTKLREVGITVVKTTEFVQGQTCRWGLAWSFLPLVTKIISSHVASKNVLTFMLEGLHRQYSAFHVLQSVESYFSASGASCKSNAALFYIDIKASKSHCESMMKNQSQDINGAACCHYEWDVSNDSIFSNSAPKDLCFRITIFQQIPGTLLVKGSLPHTEKTVPGIFPLIFQQLEDAMRNQFCKKKLPADLSHSTCAK